MGWWKTGQGDDIMGDDGADSLIASLKDYAKMEGQKPSFQELLDATANVLRFDGERFLSDPKTLEDGEVVEAVFAEPAPTLVSQSIMSTPLTTRLLLCFHEIAEQYLYTGHKRKPRLSEILSIIDFVLGVDPEDLLRDAEGLKLLGFRVQRQPRVSSG